MATTAPQREPVARALDVLTWIANHISAPLGVRQIARDIGTAPSTVHRILATLEERRMIGRSEDGQYVIGLELYRICESIAGDLSPTRIAMPYIESLARACGETSLFGVYDAPRRRMMFSSVVESTHQVRHVLEIHKWLPIHSGATGLAILAYLPPRERNAIYAEGLEAFTPATLIVPEEIEAELARIRESGYANSIGQRAAGAVGFAAPVFDCEHRVCGDVCVSLPEQRFEAGEFEASLVALLKAASKDVTEAMHRAGYRSCKPDSGFSRTTRQPRATSAPGAVNGALASLDASR